jgi:ABC-2 type transport system ATP-binding protein
MSPPTVEFHGLTKRFGASTAVQDVTFQVAPGRVVGLLGRNGAGKTTILRCLLGLSRPTAGAAEVFGAPYRDLPRAAHRIGVTLDSIGHLPGATGASELSVWARTLGLPRARVDEVLGLVDLADSAGKRLKSYSTGMKQRHALACALLPDPELLILDEPANGLDPEGIRWLRETIRGLAAQGRTVLLCSHQLAEVAQTVDDVVVLQNTVRFAGPLAELTAAGDRLEDRFFELVDAGSATASAASSEEPVSAANRSERGLSRA